MDPAPPNREKLNRRHRIGTSIVDSGGESAAYRSFGREVRTLNGSRDLGESRRFVASADARSEA